MKKELKLIDKLCIYGDFYTVLSEECYGCDNFRYICGGPEDGRCPAGIFDFDKYVAYAHKLLEEKVEYNGFLFARLLGETKENLINHSKEIESKMSEEDKLDPESTHNEIVSDIKKALEYSDEKIECLKKELCLDLTISDLEPIINNTFPCYIEEVTTEDCKDLVDSDTGNYNCVNENYDTQGFWKNETPIEDLVDEDEIPF